jgi:hypothetical protein
VANEASASASTGSQGSDAGRGFWSLTGDPIRDEYRSRFNGMGPGFPDHRDSNEPMLSRIPSSRRVPFDDPKSVTEALRPAMPALAQSFAVESLA